MEPVLIGAYRRMLAARGGSVARILEDPGALSQVTYCPRLYYLQYVDCVVPTNGHVEAGRHDHRRVDDPELAHKTRKDVV